MTVYSTAVLSLDFNDEPLRKKQTGEALIVLCDPFSEMTPYSRVIFAEHHPTEIGSWENSRDPITTAKKTS
ncbi:hypothetical protein PSI23_10230 [Xenorhabdus sp. XENO-10]|uniref:Uncharacterized protein n=1 Tax=Xenorhabdus yunnanensis TaxID=3025878 RepID=A0ABT5LGP2_9GAMM|nr:hypothetical protein [Xenorhabdus yunnanensis]MDC9589663.1 hypothetical protein [Xenorhabdus yunnanensis]